MLTQLFKAAAVVAVLKATMSAQNQPTPALRLGLKAAAVNDYLPEVRIFPPASPEFAQIATKLGVDATLSTLGDGRLLLVAIRNDSGQAVELRILFQVTSGGKTMPHDTEVGRVLQAGEATLVAPREVGGALALLMSAGRPGMVTGFTGPPTAQPLDFYQGAQVTASIDSATLLATGKFIGNDTRGLYDQLVAADAARKKFYSDVVEFQAAGLSQSEIEKALTARKANADKAALRDLPNTESGLCTEALVRLQYFGIANLFELAAKENAALQSKPTLHR
jgi:hypothetical protein